MNRRTFLTRICGGLVATAIVANLPLAIFPEKLKYYAACDFMLKKWREHTRGLKIGECPRYAIASPDLFEAYESEIEVNWRFTSTEVFRAGFESLMFKGCALRAFGPRGTWVVLFTNDREKFLHPVIANNPGRVA